MRQLKVRFWLENQKTHKFLSGSALLRSNSLHIFFDCISDIWLQREFQPKALSQVSPISFYRPGVTVS